MTHERYRYFIELQPAATGPLSRAKEREIRRRTALEFVTGMQCWLEESGMDEKVASMDVTLFGQVLITCEKEVIDLVRDQDVLNVASIRQAASLEKLSLTKMRLSA